MVFLYTLPQISLWWMFYISAFFWKIFYPFHARQVAKSKRIKYIHRRCVIVGLLLPLAPVIAVMADFAVAVGSNEFLIRNNVTFLSGGLGFVSVSYNPFCGTFNREIVFYILLVPILFNAIVTVLLILIIRHTYLTGESV